MEVPVKQTFHKVGLIGFGSRGQGLAETIINDLPEYAEIAAVADLRPAPSPTPLFSTRCPDAPFFTDYRQLLAMPELDSVIVSTYEDTHVQIVKDAVLADKAVYCEKPIVPDLEQAEELYRFVTAHDCYFQIGLNLPNFPVPRKLRRLLEEKAIGNLILIRSACDVGREFARSVLMTKFIRKRGNFIPAKLTHDTDLLQYLAGSYAEEVWGKTGNFLWRRHGEPAATDDTALIAGVLHNGVFFTQSLTSCGSSYGRKIHLFGTGGELIADLHANELTLIRPGAGPETIAAGSAGGGAHNGADALTLAGFFDYIDSGIKKAHTPERILSSVMIPLAALSGKCVPTGQWYRSIACGNRKRAFGT